MRFLHVRIRPRQCGPYFDFWAVRVLKCSSETQLAKILDALVARRSDMQSDGSQIEKTLQELVLIYLAHYLEHHEANCRPEQLYDWLRISSLARGARTFEFGVRQSETRIREFLESRPDMIHALMQMYKLRAVDASQPLGNPLSFLITNGAWGRACRAACATGKRSGVSAEGRILASRKPDWSSWRSFRIANSVQGDCNGGA